MSRCYPFPPPGYEKKAAQPPELLPSTKKEKHKHKDKEKKKKRKREDGAKDENAHKDKRSSKHQKAAVANDVGLVHAANGRVQHETDRQPGSAGLDEAAHGREATRTAERARETGKLEAGKAQTDRPVQAVDRGREAGKVQVDREADREAAKVQLVQASREAGGKVQADKIVQAGDRGRETGKQVEAIQAEADKSFAGREADRSGREGKAYGESSDRAEKERTASAAERTGMGRAADKLVNQGGKYSQVDRAGSGRPPEKKSSPKVKDRDRGSREVNGRVPSLVLAKPLDTGQQPKQERDQQRSGTTTADVKPTAAAAAAAAAAPTAAAVAAVAEAAPQVGNAVNVRANDALKAPEINNKGGKELNKQAEKEVKAAEKEEKRSRFLAPIELPPVSNLEEDRMDWLLVPVRASKVGQSETEVLMDAGDGNDDTQVVWSEPVFMPSLDMYALPYVVPY